MTIQPKQEAYHAQETFFFAIDSYFASAAHTYMYYTDAVWIYTKQTDPSTPAHPEQTDITDITDPSDTSTETAPIQSDITTDAQETQHTKTGTQTSDLQEESAREKAATALKPDTEPGNTEITEQEATDMTQTSNGAGMDRITYRDGFYQETLSDTLIERITGSSYHENDDISLDQLRFLHVLYYDFNNEIKDGELICNKQIADDLLEIFSTLYDNAYQIDKIQLIDVYDADDDLSCADDNTACFNYRVVAGSTTLSKHALGMAIDINPFYNPYVTYPDGKERISPAGSEVYADRSNDNPHMIRKGDLCYQLFIDHGFTWGGEWKSLKDYQHFQKVIN